MMRLAVAAAFLGCIGCSKEAPARQDRSVWWPAVAAWNDSSLDSKVSDLLAGRHINVILVASRGSRIRVPYDRSAEATELLRNAPFAAELRIHSILAGPRPGSGLPLLGVESGDIGWTQLLSIPRSESSQAEWTKVQELLHHRSIECGAVAYAWDKGAVTVYVPSGSEVAARNALGNGALQTEKRPK